MEEKNFILELIEVFRSLPALWDVKSKEYSDRNVKNDQYEILLSKYKEKFPEATQKTVTRTSYRREMKRISALERSGAGLSEENEPTLFYCDAMAFLKDSEKPCTSRISICVENETEDDDLPTKKRKKPESNEELIAQAAKRLMQLKDDFRKIGETWAAKLKEMDRTQRMYAEKFISEILFEGLMGILHRNAMQLNVESRASTPPSTMNHFSNVSNSEDLSFVEIPMISPECNSSDISNMAHFLSTFQ